MILDRLKRVLSRHQAAPDAISQRALVCMALIPTVQKLTDPEEIAESSLMIALALIKLSPDEVYGEERAGVEAKLRKAVQAALERPEIDEDVEVLLSINRAGNQTARYPQQIREIATRLRWQDESSLHKHPAVDLFLQKGAEALIRGEKHTKAAEHAVSEIIRLSAAGLLLKFAKGAH